MSSNEPNVAFPQWFTALVGMLCAITTLWWGAVILANGWFTLPALGFEAFCLLGAIVLLKHGFSV